MSLVNAAVRSLLQMDKHYDAIVLGTGLKECILSGLLSVHGFKVLHMDRNTYYGGESASLNVSQLFEKFENGSASPAELGPNRDWNVDLVPKFILAAGKLVKTLVHTDVKRYLDFKSCNGSFVVKDKENIHRVPATLKSALSTKLMGLLEKNRMRKLLELVAGLHSETSKYKGKYDLETMTMAELFAVFKLKPNTQYVVGHAMALHLDDSYLERPAIETCERIYTYCLSLARFGQAPYIYPLYGLGELPQAFARLSAVWGGVYMLDKSIDELLFNEDGAVKGIRSGEESVYCNWLIGDPSYFPQYVSKTGSVARGICILKDPIPQCVAASDPLKKDRVPSCHQVILPGYEADRENDVYITTQGCIVKTSPKTAYLGFVSGLAEGQENEDDAALDQQALERELRGGLNLLAPCGIRHQWLYRTDVLTPNRAECEPKNIFISESYDATSHFETTIDDVLGLFERITGQQVNLDDPPKKPVMLGEGQ
ncbi:Rab GDI protein [Kipferlia bialata]|uniref:Rab GDP dissociation inhibitor n=1 Tax=Kipferlia bialata TaxID=797122 RepID=A0A9K3CSY0_9EUKA|nr:Rab GDI protein [Kipferlia bialata]|eukprot:g3437.t1